MTNTTPTPTPAHRAPEPVLRAARTFIQGAVVVTLAGAALAAATVVQTWTGAELLDGRAWSGLGIVAATAGLHTLAAYVHAKVRPPV